MYERGERPGRASADACTAKMEEISVNEVAGVPDFRAAIAFFFVLT
jgi:hypothetical protein